MKLSILIPWRNRPELAETLRRNAQWFEAADAEVLVVSGGGDRRQVRDLIRNRGERLRLVEAPLGDGFNKSACLNLGAYFSRGDCLFTLDTDVILTSTFLDEAVETTSRRECFVTVAEVVESHPEIRGHGEMAGSSIMRRTVTTELTGKNGNTASIVYGIRSNGTRTGAGLVVVKKEHFRAVQGLNSNLRGWGFEDFDLQNRLQLALGLERLSFGEVLHLSHPRVSENDFNLANRATCYENYARGDFQGTLDADVQRWKDNAVEAVL